MTWACSALQPSPCPLPSSPGSSILVPYKELQQLLVTLPVCGALQVGWEWPGGDARVGRTGGPGDILFQRQVLPASGHGGPGGEPGAAAPPEGLWVLSAASGWSCARGEGV